MKLSSLIWCIVGCRIPSDEIFAEKYETKIMRKEMFMDPMLCFIFHFFNEVLTKGRTFGRFFPNRIKTIEHISLKFYLTNNRVWWCLVPTNYQKLVEI
jgi:hypothetical protein